MTAWAFCTDCSWTTTAGSIDVAGDGERHAGMRGHVVTVAGSTARATQSTTDGLGGAK